VDRNQPITIVAHRIAFDGGHERVMAKLATALADRGHPVTVVARRCDIPDHPRISWIRVPGPLRPVTIGYPWFFLAGSIAAARRPEGLLHTTGALVLNRADVSTVHFCGLAFQREMGLPRRSKEGLAYQINERISDLITRWTERFIYRPSRTRHLVPVSRGLANELDRYFPAMHGHQTVIPNGVDVAAFARDAGSRRRVRDELDLAEDTLVALFVGGDWERKGVRHAIEALAAAPDWQLIVVGPGDEERFRELAVASQVRERVHFVGRQTNTAPYYSAADAFVFPTAYEAFPLSPMEAAAAGLPLIATRANGIEDVLVDGINGFFVERDSSQIAARLVELSGDRGRLEQMGAAARDRIREWDWDRMVESYVAVYDRLAAGVA
jgi:glycosyltransferase involved in cell wall biosynthesis